MISKDPEISLWTLKHWAILKARRREDDGGGVSFNKSRKSSLHMSSYSERLLKTFIFLGEIFERISGDVLRNIQREWMASTFSPRMSCRQFYEKKKIMKVNIGKFAPSCTNLNAQCRYGTSKFLQICWVMVWNIMIQNKVHYETKLRPLHRLVLFSIKP